MFLAKCVTFFALISLAYGTKTPCSFWCRAMCGGKMTYYCCSYDPLGRNEYFKQQSCEELANLNQEIPKTATSLPNQDNINPNYLVGQGSRPEHNPGNNPENNVGNNPGSNPENRTVNSSGNNQANNPAKPEKEYNAKNDVEVITGTGVISPDGSKQARFEDRCASNPSVYERNCLLERFNVKYCNDDDECEMQQCCHDNCFGSGVKICK